MSFSGNYVEENQSYDKFTFEVGSKRPENNLKLWNSLVIPLMIMSDVQRREVRVVT